MTTGSAATTCLTIDTCAGAMSVAAGRGGMVLARVFLGDARAAAEKLAPAARDVLAAAGLAADAIDLIAVTRGPGTFTGVRIGLGFARGLALASGAALLGVTSLELLAAGAVATSGAGAAGRDVMAVIDARRGEVYVQRVDAQGRAGTAEALTPEAAAAALIARPALVVGAGAALLAPLLPGDLAARLIRSDLPHGHGQPDAADLVALADAHSRRHGLPDPRALPPSPLYLRAPDALPPAPSGIETPS
ncbi:tRNA (adenosine(37)-N6)-threonylcarbamoyltransferase complex dimerization subunit type 1 TsaB [Tistrella bauzanensis]|uniref:tRNA (Adenosine(37)-N6)-threonylcarbamoyltransferase complex dimerization subunit type 1 TsaB n=1 Tax=Tistrella bauzanensis TaxID=657419 RepID=A0ABQ1IC97_9PROT|nr:tRNA (adenosine(37)-N6)-threonylcarbamoyltransferase complex dimerization subunit type 1 TsaB [Tistrella bauzanensis]GGB34499.1 tRNA (adenosine(37)-N6)-threonylcarbamoyltransferase complex dimerization subunit type 1 TsaB [Tistrella bauzanensis]